MSESMSRIFGYVHAGTSGRAPTSTVQEEMILARAESLEGRWVHCREDGDPSAADVRWSKRPAFRELMRELEPDDHLIVWRLDRLDRTLLGMVAALEWPVKKGVCVHILEHGGLQMDLDQSTGRILVMLLAATARLLVDCRREALPESIQLRKGAGMAYNKLPRLGKCRMPTDIFRNGKRTLIGCDVWDGGECDVIREIWWRHEQGETLYSIAKDLRARDARRWNGAPWVPDGSRRQRGAGKRYPLNSRTVQRAFWRYTAMLAQGCDLWDIAPAPQDVQRAIWRLKEYRVRWTRKGQRGRVPKEVRALLERKDLAALSEITPKSWGEASLSGARPVVPRGRRVQVADGLPAALFARPHASRRRWPTTTGPAIMSATECGRASSHVPPVCPRGPALFVGSPWQTPPPTGPFWISAVRNGGRAAN